MDELTESFGKSLLNESSDVLSDYIEIGIDSFINDGILKEVPIVKSIVSVLKIGKNIHDRNLLKQTITFINEFNNNSISKEKLNDYKEKFEKDDKCCKEELSRVLLLLNNFMDKEKSIFLAKLFKAYINQTITWNEFGEYSEIINRMFLEDVTILKSIKDGIEYKGKAGDNFRVERLYSLGIIGNRMFADYDRLKENVIEGRCLNIIGKKFCSIIF